MKILSLLASLFFPTIAFAITQSGSVNGAAGNISGTMTATQFVGGGAGITGVVSSSAPAHVNASLTGDGTTGAPFGVNPSSVPVFQSGAYPAASGAAITSLTAANLTGAVPTGSVNLSTVTTVFTAVAVSTTATYSALNSTASALSTLATLTAANTTTIYAAVNSTGSALTTETNRAISAENVLSVSTASLNTAKASTGTCTLPDVALVLTSGSVTCSEPSNVTGNAATVTTNANLTGDVTSAGNATTAAATQANIKVLSGLTTISNPYTATSSMTNTSAGGILASSSMTASAFFGDGSHLSNVAGPFSGGTVSGQTTFQSTVTVQGNAFSVGGSTFVVSAGNVGIGNTAPAYPIDMKFPLATTSSVRKLQLTDGTYITMALQVNQSTAIWQSNGALGLSANGSSTNALLISTDGIVSEPLQSDVEVHQSADTTIAAGATTKIAFNTVETDTQSEFITASNRMLVKRAGGYIVSANCYLYASVVSGNQYQILIYKNGSQFKASALSFQSTNGQNLSTTEVMTLAVGDYLEIFVYNPPGSGATASCYSATGPYFSRFSVAKFR